MLAPSEVAGLIPSIDSDYPQLVIKGTEVAVHLIGRGQPREAEIRICARDFLKGKLSCFPDFALLISDPNLQSIVFRRTVYQDANLNLKELLAEHGYINIYRSFRYVVVWRD
jgi:hypothetical protein